MEIEDKLKYEEDSFSWTKLSQHLGKGEGYV